MSQTTTPPLPSRTLATARRLRESSTDAERRLWQCLRGGQLDGLKFRRQHPIPPYVVDFYCDALKLVVELDGSQHTEQADRARTTVLESRGLTILRFWDNEVLTQIDAVVEAIFNSALVNDVDGVLKSALGAAQVRRLPPITPSEDFSEYVNAGVPAMFFLVGVHDPKDVEASRQPGGKPLPGNHSPFFAPVPEPSIKTSVKAMSLAVLTALQR